MIQAIIDKISKLQSTGDEIYPSGIFPSQRVHPATGYCREDDNIFFSALIVFTLQQLREHFPAELGQKIDDMITKVTVNYPNYRHPADRSTYNFWQDRNQGHFPHGKLLKRMSFMALPADADDTSLIYLTSLHQAPTGELKHKFEHHYADEAPISPLTPVAYADLRAYPTFLGKRIKREVDVCVVCNVLYLVLKNNLPLSCTDFDSIEMIKRVLKRRDYLSNPFQVSPHYGKTSIILYHISRLVGDFSHREELNGLSKLLIDCLQQEKDRTPGFMELVLITTSLFRLKQKPAPLKEPPHWHEVFNNFYFFQAGMLTGLQNQRLGKLTGMDVFHLRYRCPAYYWTLWLEYLILASIA